MRSTASEPRYGGGPWLLAGLLWIAALSTWPALGLRPTPYDQGLLGLLGLTIVLGLRSIHRHPVYPYVVVLVLSTALGHMGLMLGLAADFGSAGLLLMASWCSGIGDRGALEMFAVAPWGHVGMLIGCNAGMLMAGCGRLVQRNAAVSGPAFLFLCNLGMIAGMAAVAGLSDRSSGFGLVGTAGITLAGMSFGMIAGMIGVWWLLQHHLGPQRMALPIPADEENQRCTTQS